MSRLDSAEMNPVLHMRVLPGFHRPVPPPPRATPAVQQSTAVASLYNRTRVPRTPRSYAPKVAPPGLRPKWTTSRLEPPPSSGTTYRCASRAPRSDPKPHAQPRSPARGSGPWARLIKAPRSGGASSETMAAPPTPHQPGDATCSNSHSSPSPPVFSARRPQAVVSVRASTGRG